jgi:hypothetical protein
MMVNGNFVSSPVRFNVKSADKAVDMNGNDLYKVVGCACASIAPSEKHNNATAINWLPLFLKSIY